MPKPMPQVPSYPADTPVSGDKFLFNKVSNNTTKTVTLANLATAIRSLISSFFTSSTIVPSTAPAAGRVLVGNAGGTAYAPVAISGDVTLSSTGAATIAAGSVTPAKQSSIAASKLVGRGSAAGAGSPEPIDLGTGLSMSGTTLNVSAGTGNVTQASNASAADHLFVSGAADKSRVETPVTVDPSTGDMDGVGDVIAETLETPEIHFSTSHSADDTGKGEVISDINAGETIAQFEAVYYSFADGEWMKADANAAGKFPANGIALGASTNGNPITVLIKGSIRNDAWTWVSGLIYLDITAGALSQTPPSVSGEAIQAVGFAKTADIAFFNFGTAYSLVP